MTEWLQDIPTHWTIAPVKRHFDVQLGKMLQSHPLSPSDQRVTYMKAKHVQWLVTHTDELPQMWASPRDIDQYGIQSGDLLICEGGEGGRCAVIMDPGKQWVIQNALHRVRPHHEHPRNDHSSNLWLQYVLRAIASLGWLDVITNKTTIAHLTVDKLNALMIPIPIEEEQRILVSYLRREISKIDALIRQQEYLPSSYADVATAISVTRQEIDLLHEYRTRLISDVVTGKVDVRGITDTDVETVA